MDQATLVTLDIVAYNSLLFEFDKHQHILAAAWLFSEEEPNGYLYVVLQGLTPEKLKSAYAQLLSTVDQLDHIDPLYLQQIDPFRIKLLYPDEPEALDLLEIQQRGDKSKAKRLNGYTVGNSYITSGYLCPATLGQTPA